MTRFIPHTFLTIAALVTFSFPRSASAGIPIIYGSGEVIADVAELSVPASSHGSNLRVGYLYNRAHLYYCNAWTWNGRFVLYAGDRYHELSDADWQHLLGDAPEVKFEKPMAYRFPIVLSVLGILMTGGSILGRILGTDRRQIRRLCRDRRYEAALNHLFEKQPDGPQHLVTNVDPEKLHEASLELSHEGIPYEEAKANLQIAARFLLSATNCRIDANLEYADQLIEQGRLNECIEVFERLVEQLPESDSRKSVVNERLVAIREHSKLTCA